MRSLIPNSEIPCIKPESSIPQKLIPFSKAVGGTDYNCFVHFYEDDANFERLWNNPQKYLQILQKYKGVITPDFSLYRDMPLVMQQWKYIPRPSDRSLVAGKWYPGNTECSVGRWTNLRPMLCGRTEKQHHRRRFSRLYQAFAGTTVFYKRSWLCSAKTSPEDCHCLRNGAGVYSLINTENKA